MQVRRALPLHERSKCLGHEPRRAKECTRDDGVVYCQACGECAFAGEVFLRAGLGAGTKRQAEGESVPGRANTRRAVMHDAVERAAYSWRLRVRRVFDVRSWAERRYLDHH